MWEELLIHLGQDVADVVPGVAVQTLLQPLLVKKVTNEPNRPPKHKQTIQ